MEDDIKRWTAKRKTALILDIIQGKTTVAEASRAYDLPPSEIEGWVEEGKKGMENALRSKPLEVKEQYERQLRELQEAYGEAMLELRARKKIELSAGQLGRQIILELQQALREEGVIISLVKLCGWFGVPRRTVYYKPTKGDPKVQDQYVKPIKAMIEENPSFGYRTVAHLLDMNKNTVQRVFQIMGWQVRKRPVGLRPRIQALPSVATAPNESALQNSSRSLSKLQAAVLAVTSCPFHGDGHDSGHPAEAQINSLEPIAGNSPQQPPQVEPGCAQQRVQRIAL